MLTVIEKEGKRQMSAVFGGMIMNPVVVIIIVVIAVLFLLALRHSIMHAGKCSDCDGTKCGTCAALNEMAEDLQKKEADRTQKDVRGSE